MDEQWWRKGETTGFPSPARSWRERPLRLDDLLIVHPASTFFVRVQDASMSGAGIVPGDLLVVDRALEPVTGSLVVVAIKGRLRLKRLVREAETCFLQSEPRPGLIRQVAVRKRFAMWGVVLLVIGGRYPALSLDDLVKRWGHSQQEEPSS